MVLPVSAVPFLCKCFSKQNPAVGFQQQDFIFFYIFARNQ